MERNHTQFKRHTSDQEHQAHNQNRHLRIGMTTRDLIRNFRQAQATASCTVHQRHTKQQQTGSNRAQDEILHRCLNRTHMVTTQGHQRIQRQSL